jgi:hypothetical protein
MVLLASFVKGIIPRMGRDSRRRVAAIKYRRLGERQRVEPGPRVRADSPTPLSSILSQVNTAIGGSSKRLCFPEYGSILGPELALQGHG